MKNLLILLALLTLPAVCLAEASEHMVDTEKSKILWTGRKVTGAHNGHLSLSSGKVSIKDGKVTAGEFTIDMNTIVNEDIKSEGTRKQLEGHLKSDDFFSVAKFPLASFKITGTETKDDKQLITGDLTVKGISNPITIPAVVTEQDGKYVATAKVMMDRSKWDVRYNSGSFFDIKALGDKLIYDDMEIELKLYTR